MKKHMGDPTIVEVFSDSILGKFYAETLFGKLEEMINENKWYELASYQVLAEESHLLTLIHLN